MSAALRHLAAVALGGAMGAAARGRDLSAGRCGWVGLTA